MVKGNSRQVIVVKPQAQLFEQAIFLLREDAVESGGVSPRELLEQAQDIADRNAFRLFDTVGKNNCNLLHKTPLTIYHFQDRLIIARI